MSTKDLVIVESPAKARTIGRLLGANYFVTASMGHVRDLPERTLGVDIQNDFKPVYQVQKKSVIASLKGPAQEAKKIYLASDPDREGEAISWHIQEILKKDTKAEFKRVVFHEITNSAVNKAFKTPGKINMNLVDAQQARRILDRIVGYQTSEFLWTKVEKGASAGRVQSVALRVICEREKLVLDFNPQEYWNIFVDFEVAPSGSGMKFRAKLATVNGEKAVVASDATAKLVSDAIGNSKNCRVAGIEVKERKKYAPPPFITSTVQQAASSSLRFSASHTMSIAQQLYEGIELGSSGPVGLITYMRTDSFTVANEALEACRSYISREIGPEFLPAYPNKFKSSARAQEAHEAIRPTDVNKKPEDIKSHLSSDQLRLYTLIWKRFVASQMKPAEIKSTTLESALDGGDGRDYRFKTIKTDTVFSGYTKMYDVEDVKDDSKNDDTEGEEKADLSFLPTLKPDNELSLLKSASEQKFTEPPPRFSEASLIRELETNGIGRPSTYATIVNTIQKRKYVLKNKGKLVPTELGFKVNDCLVGAMPSLFDIGFTAKMENELDDIEEGKVQWTEMLKEFYAKFAVWLENAKTANVPKNDTVGKFVSLFDNIKDWKMEPRAGRKHNDKEFFDSLKENFGTSGRLTDRQWKAVILLAARYKDQIPGLKEIADAGGFSAELASATEYTEKLEENIRSGAQESAMEEHKKLIDEITIEKPDPSAPPVKKGRFNEAQFLKSLKKQLERGKIFTEKQLNALKNIKMRREKPNGQEGSQNEGGQTTAPGNNPEDLVKIEKAFKVLNEVQKWDEPVRKGKRVFDDKAFFGSIHDQFKSGRNLSPKQIYAIAKIADKYSKENRTENLGE